jgi:asparagine synthetase B (glutamine-hydrolysing)
VEVRSPFLDDRVVEAALRLPVREKAGTWARPEGKRALKRAFADLIGAETANAPKMGFGYALQESELLRGPFRAAVTERLLDGGGIAICFHRPAVEARVRAHMEGGEDHGKLLLGLYAFEAWHAEFVA